MGFQVIFSGELQIPPVFVSVRQKFFEYRWRFLVLCLGFRGGNPPTDPKLSDSVGGNPQPMLEWSIRAVSGSGLGGLLELVGLPSWVDSPTFSHSCLSV